MARIEGSGGVRLKRTIAALLLSFAMTQIATADEIYRCKLNARAGRDFAHALVKKPGWCGSPDNCNAAPFGIKTFREADFQDISYREFLIGIPEKGGTVKVKSFLSPLKDGKPSSEEFKAEIVGRDGSVVFFTYRNPSGNKVHSYALDMERKHLVGGGVEYGVTSLAVVARTFDCE